ncbi:MAG: hypothetical protein RLZZ414_388, partial [Bacteroidota bacterium]
MKLKKLLFSVLTGFSLSFTATAQVPNYVPTNGLQAWYPFNGNATDESANTNNGTVNGATLTTDRFGKPNSAYSFDGVNDYIDIIHNGILTFNSQNSFTISTWVKINSKKTTHTIISHKFNHRNGFVFDINLGGKVRFELEGDIDGINATIISQDTLSHNKWHHLVAYYDGINREMGIFVNGELVDSVKNITTNLIGNFGVNTVNVRIGDRINNPDNTWLDGSVDDISIFNRVLTSEEILQLYNNVKINNCSIEAKIEIIGNKNYNDTVVLCNQSQLMLKAYNFNDSLGLYKFKWYKNNVVIQGAN